jgi:tetratricopeptide (TPR) repeat protein
MIFCRGCGQSIHETAAACPKCGAPQGVVAAPGVAEIPPGIRGWSWGAFLFNWVWGVCNGVWISLLVLVPFVGWIFAIVLGIKGREWAWKNKKWQNVEHFQRVQRAWSAWALGITGGAIVIGIVAAVALPAYVGYKQRAAEVQRITRENEMARERELANAKAESDAKAIALAAAPPVEASPQTAAQPSAEEPPGNTPAATPTSQQSSAEDLAHKAAACSAGHECVEAMLAAALPRRPDLMQVAAGRLLKTSQSSGDRKSSRDANTRGLARFASGDYQGAWEQFQRADQLNPSDAEVKSNLGLTYVKLGKSKEAISMLIQSLELDPRRSSAWAPMAEALSQAQLPDHALAALLLTYEFSGNKQKTADYFRSRLMASDQPSGDGLRTAFEQAVKIVEAGY